MLSLCDGCGGASLALERLWSQLRLGAEVEVTVVEIDGTFRRFTKWRFPEELVGWSNDVNDWAADGFRLEAYGKRFWFDLVIAGFPCQDLSSAYMYKQGAGLDGSRSGLFFQIWKVIEKLRRVNSKVEFVLEWVDFRRKHPEDFQEVTTVTGVQIVILCASRLASCYRRRAFWASSRVPELEQRVAEPWQVLEQGICGVGRSVRCVAATIWIGCRGKKALSSRGVQ